MAIHTTYYVQGFKRRGKALAKAEMLAFKTEHEARRRGEKLAQTVAGVMVYSVEGDFEADDFSEPRLLARWGDVPEVD